MTKKYVRVGFTSAQKTELWERWRSGEQMKSIGRELGKRSSSIFSRGLVAGRSVRIIARRLGRAASTISREIARNGGVSRYRAVAAEKRAWKQALRPKPCKLVLETELFISVIRKVRGNVGVMRTQTDCSANISPKVRTYLCIAKRS